MPQDIHITSITCTLGGSMPKFTVKWSQKGSYGSSVHMSGAQGAGSGNTWTTSAPLSTTRVYNMTVVPTSGSGHRSNAVPALFYPDTDIEARFDGQNLSVFWASPEGATQPTDTRIVLNNTAGSQIVNTGNTNSVSFVVSSNLLDGDHWTVTLTPIRGVAYGPTSPKISVTVEHSQPANQTGPNLTALRIDSVSAGQLTATVSTPVDPQKNNDVYYAGVVSWRNVPLTTSTAVAPGDSVNGIYTFAVTVPGQYDVAQAYTLSLALAFGPGENQAVGNMGQGMDLLLDEPLHAEVSVIESGKDRKVTVAVEPTDGPSKPSGVQIGLYDPTGNLIPNTEVGGAGFVHTTTLPSPATGKSYTASAALLRGSDIGPVAKVRWPLICTVPTLKEVRMTDGAITATWTAISDQGITGYQLIASCDGADIAHAVFDDVQGCLPIPAGRIWKESQTVQIRVQGVGRMTTGPASAPVTALSSTPFNLSASYKVTGSTCLLSWQARGDDVVSYETEILQGETCVKQYTGSKTEVKVGTEVLDAGGGFRFRVRIFDQQTLTRYGPWSLPVPILTGAPANLAVDYNGTTLAARFTPVPEATGYQLTLVKDESAIGEPWYTPGPHSKTSLDPTKAEDTSLAVQAVGPGMIGPATLAPVFTPGWYPQTVSGTNGETQCLKLAVSSNMAAHTINIGLPDIFLATPSSLPIAEPFTLNTADSAHNPPYAYTLTIRGEGTKIPWSFNGEAVRAELFTAYQSLLFQLETYGATPSGVQTVQAAIARAMPMTFVETLLYAYGFTGDRGCVDLLPGMVLRAEHASYRTLSRATPNQNYLNGFIPGAVAEYSIARIGEGAGFTALDAFIGRLVARGGVTVPTPLVDGKQQAGAGGLIDSGVEAMRQPFLRLVYPRTFLSDESDDQGSPKPGDNAMILAAPSYTLLEAATTSVRTDGSLPDGVGALYFRGRSTLTPGFQVWLDGTPVDVSPGATVDGLLAMRAMNPANAPVPLSGVRMWRGVQSALVDQPSVYNIGGAMPVRLDQASATNKAPTALPLLAGDRIVSSPKEEVTQ